MSLRDTIVYTKLIFSLIYFLQFEIEKNFFFMLTLFKQIFTWWNHQTLGTRLHTFFKGKFVGKDENGNKYYESKNGRRWVIYNGEVDSTKIPNDWFSWIHFTKNKIEKAQGQKKFSWQKSHKPNLTGTDKAYHPKKSENENKKYKSWKE